MNDGELAPVTAERAMRGDELGHRGVESARGYS
jgi:hypothetical protein